MQSKSFQQARPETISLNALKREDTKNPTTQNVFNLKNAIAEALKKQQPAPSARPTQPVQHTLPTQLVKLEEKKDEKKSEHISSREVPESVLREILSMDKSA